MSTSPQFFIRFTGFQFLRVTEMLAFRQPNRALRSTNQLLLEVPSSRCKHWGWPAFSVAGPRLWNKLPPPICAPLLTWAFSKQGLKLIYIDWLLISSNAVAFLCIWYYCKNSIFGVGLYFCFYCSILFLLENTLVHLECCKGLYK